MRLREFGEGKCTDLRGARTSLLISPFLIFCLFFLYFREKNKQMTTFCTKLIIDFGHLYGISGKRNLENTF